MTQRGLRPQPKNEGEILQIDRDPEEKGQPQRAQRSPREIGETLTGSRREFFLCNLCALRALCGLTLFGTLVLPFVVWPKPRLRKSSRRAKKKTVSITNERIFEFVSFV